MIIIYGPTGCGKTDFSLALAEKMRGEIINMDSGSFYTPLTIGTAKPDWKKHPVPHHLFDTINQPVNFTVAQYRAQVQILIGQIYDRGNIPILVGGSGFYLKSLFFPPQASPADDAHFHDDGSQSTEVLWHQLAAIDAVRAAQIDQHDRYRIVRALDIWHATGMLPSSFKPLYQPVAPATIFHLTRDRTQLYERINERVLNMMDQGWIDEVRALENTPWHAFLKEKKIIGYDDILNYLGGQQDEKAYRQLIATIATKCRHYAKRQETFWRMLEKEFAQIEEPRRPLIRTINLTLIDLELYIKQLLYEQK